MRNEIDLRFCIWNFDDITPDDITALTGLTPAYVFIKGKPRNPKLSVLAKQNGWIIDSSLDKYTSFQDQMTALLDIIESKIEVFRPLCEKYSSEFACALKINCYGEESTPWVHLDKRYHDIAGSLGIEFDVDLYCLPKE
jgi:hypothetical protein